MSTIVNGVNGDRYRTLDRRFFLLSFFFYLRVFFLSSTSSLALDRTAILATMPRLYFRVVRNDNHKVGEITL